MIAWARAIDAYRFLHNENNLWYVVGEKSIKNGDFTRASIMEVTVISLIGLAAPLRANELYLIIETSDSTLFVLSQLALSAQHLQLRIRRT